MSEAQRQVMTLLGKSINDVLRENNMNNLPTTLEGLIDLLEEFEAESFDNELGTSDYDGFAEKVLTTLEQYRLKNETNNPQ